MFNYSENGNFIHWRKFPNQKQIHSNAANQTTTYHFNFFFMRNFTQTIFLGLLSLATLSTTAVQAQKAAARGPRSFSELTQPRQKGERKATDALRGINTTVVRPGQSVNYYWDNSTRRWAVSNKLEYTYDAGARVTQELYRDSASSQPLDRTLYTFNGQGQQTSYTSQGWNGSAWQNQYRGLATYDARGNETQYLSQSWKNNAWFTDYGSQQVYTYNAAGVITEQISKDLVNGVYINDDRMVFTLTNGQWSSILFQDWEDTRWEDSRRLVDIVWYDWASQKPTSYREQDFDGTAFVDEERTTITYTSNGGSVTIEQDYDGTNWVNDYRGTDSYDNFGNYLSYTEDIWVNNGARTHDLRNHNPTL